MKWVRGNHFAISQTPQATDGLADRYGVLRRVCLWNACDFAKQGCEKHESFSSLGDAVARDIDHTERSFVSGFV